MTLNVRRRRDVKRAISMRAFLNGREVTHDCWYADVRRGVVRLYLRDEYGERPGIMVDGHGKPAWVERRGHVVLRKKVSA